MLGFFFFLNGREVKTPVFMWSDSVFYLCLSYFILCIKPSVKNEHMKHFQSLLFTFFS